jgi:hypothetical protein
MSMGTPTLPASTHVHTRAPCHYYDDKGLLSHYTILQLSFIHIPFPNSNKQRDQARLLAHTIL